MCSSDLGLEERRGEEKREEEIQAAPVPSSKPQAARSPSKPKVAWTADAGWAGITDADRSEWATAFPGAVLDQELAKANAWLKANPSRAGRRNWRAFIVRWLSKCQERGGTVRTPGNRYEDKPPPKAFTGQDAEAFERTRRALASRATT